MSGRYVNGGAVLLECHLRRERIGVDEWLAITVVVSAVVPINLPQ